MGRYIGKYISKHIGQREEEAKGKRLISSSQGWLKNSTNFAWNTDGSKEWRRKVKLFAAIHGISHELGLYCHFGPNWAYRLMDQIVDVDETLKNLERGVYLFQKGKIINAKTGEILF
jgi:hypothetical protein